MIIDSSYFTGALKIAQLGQAEVEEELNTCIEQHETEFLQKALGYELSMSFINGLQENVINEKWSNLLNGVEFTNVYGRKQKWFGFAGSNSSGVIVLNVERAPLFIHAGEDDGFDVGGYKYENPELKNWNFSFEIRTFGEQERGVEWNYLEDGGLELTDTSYQTYPGELWIIRFISRKVEVSTVESKVISPLACYVYWHYQQQLHEQQTGIGVVKTKGQGSVNVSPQKKMITAWNMMIDSLGVLQEFLNVNIDLYNYNYYDSSLGFGSGWLMYRGMGMGIGMSMNMSMRRSSMKQNIFGI